MLFNKYVNGFWILFCNLIGKELLMMKKMLMYVLSFFLFLSVNAAQAAMISVEPSVSNVLLGDIFTVSLKASDFPATQGGDVTINWDPTVISLPSLADVILTFPGWDPSFSGKGALSAGQLDDLYVATFGAANSGTFPIADLTFTAIGAGSSAITLSAVPGYPWPDANTAADIPVTYVGGVANVSAIPEPASLLLIGTGLAGILARRTRKY